MNAQQMTSELLSGDRCILCGAKATDQHHYPYHSNGGQTTLPYCRKHHRMMHQLHTTENWNDFQWWGWSGGTKTGQNPANWKRNLKQYRTEAKNG